MVLPDDEPGGGGEPGTDKTALVGEACRVSLAFCASTSRLSSSLMRSSSLKIELRLRLRLGPLTLRLPLPLLERGTGTVPSEMLVVAKTGVLGWSSITADLRRASRALGDFGDLERELSLQEESCIEPDVGLLEALDEREFMLRLMVTPPDLFVELVVVGVFRGLESRVVFS